MSASTTSLRLVYLQLSKQLVTDIGPQFFPKNFQASQR